MASDGELEDARWFSREELEEAAAGRGDMRLPPPIAIARTLIDAWLARAMIDAAALREWCLARPGVTEETPFGPLTTVFKVEGKLFALSALDSEPLQISLKCDPDWRRRCGATTPAVSLGYHLNKRHWNTVVCDGSLPDPMIIDMLEDSYDLVVSAMSRATRERLGWAPGEGPAR